MSIELIAGCTGKLALDTDELPKFSLKSQGLSDSINVLFTIAICNSENVLKSYGADALQQVLHAVSSVVSRLDGVGVAEIGADRRIRVSFPRERFDGGAALAVACEDWLRLVCRSVPLIPFWTHRGVVHVWLSGRWSVSAGDGEAEAEASGSSWLFDFSAGVSVASEEAATRYRRDMALASRLLCAVADVEGRGLKGGALRIVWRPVLARRSSEVLYYESVALFEEAAGDLRLARNTPALVERLGFGAILDEIVVAATVAELEADPSIVLSASISSVVGARDWWWGRFAARLARSPDVAARLVLEIGEATALAAGDEVRRFCGEARSLGCRIAIGGFGAGFASVRQLVTIAPDVVRIDRGFVRRSTTSSRDRAVLAGLGQLAAAIAAIVVADGVDTVAQAQLADEIGLAWQQGHFWGGASLSRPWRGARAQAAAAAAAAAAPAPISAGVGQALLVG